MMQTVADMQYRRTTRLNVKELVPHATTISRHTHTEVAKIKEAIKALLATDMDPNKFSFTLDIWTDITDDVSFAQLLF